MKLFLKILSVFFGLGFIGQLIMGRFFLFGLLLAIVCGYYGWKESESKNDNDSENKTP